jgi:hypothetical protein
MASLALLLGIAACQTAQAQQIALESKYLSTAVEGFHGYRIAGKLGGKAKLTMDPNICALNQYGDRTICTKIALTVQDVKLSELKIKDPTGQGRRLFGVSGHDLHARPQSSGHRGPKSHRSTERQIVTTRPNLFLAHLAIRLQDNTNTRGRSAPQTLVPSLDTLWDLEYIELTSRPSDYLRVR